MRTAASPPRHLGALPRSARGSGGGRGILDAALIRQLAHLRGPPEPRAPARRTRLLRRAAGRWPARPGVLLAYHDLLLFLVAYPDERAVLRLAEAELRRIAGAVVRRSPAEVTRLDGTGLPGTLTACAFSLDLARWLTRRFPRDVELDWEQARGEPATREPRGSASRRSSGRAFPTARGIRAAGSSWPGGGAGSRRWRGGSDTSIGSPSAARQWIACTTPSRSS